MKKSNYGNVLSEVVWLKWNTDGVLGAEPPATRDYGGPGAKPTSAARFLVIFLEKMLFLMPLDHVSHVFRAIWKNNIFNLCKPIEKN